MNKAAVTFSPTEDGCVKSTRVETDTMRRLLLKQLNARYKRGIDPRVPAGRKRPTEASIALGEDIKKARELYGMDTKEFAEMFRISITRMKNLEAGRADISIADLERVSKLTGTKLRISIK